MKNNVKEVMEERKKAEDEEREYIYGEKPVTHFPYTHGDSLELAREKQREQANQDLQMRKLW